MPPIPGKPRSLVKDCDPYPMTLGEMENLANTMLRYLDVINFLGKTINEYPESYNFGDQFIEIVAEERPAVEELCVKLCEMMEED